jgi:NADH-quinone oxidoreductase subunit N
MPELTENLHLLAPEFALGGLAFLVFAVDLFLPEERKGVVLGWLAIAGLVGIIVLSLVMLPGVEENLWGGLLAADAFSLFFKIVFLVMGIFFILTSVDYLKQHLSHHGEFYGLLLLSILGMNIMVQARELLTAYIALELLSFCLYVMVAYALRNPKSNEAAIKYIIIGAFSSAILLYGVSMVYSTLGTTRFAEIAAALMTLDQVSPALWAGLALLVVGLGFKLSAAPFHMWAPDTYEGAPLPVTAYLAIASKTAAFGLLLRLVAEGMVPATDRWDQWQIILAVLAAVSMMVGNLVALAQHNIKRLMAYSSIGHVGFILAGVAAMSAGSTVAANGVTFYLVGYAITSLVVFAALISYFNMTGHEEISDFAGLADRQPFLAAAIAIGLFSLAGLPIFVGFTMKFYLFTAVAAAGFLWLAGLAILASLISLYYYLQVIRQMYIQPALAAPDPRATAAVAEHHEPAEAAGFSPLARPSALILTVLALGLVAVLALGVYPAPLLDLIEASSRAILPAIP